MLKNSRKSGQALAELAIFGTVMLVVFGYLLNYGLNYNYSENAQMIAFRQALKKAYAARETYNTSSVVVVRDKPIPDPSSPFGVSSRFPVVASASAVWSNDLMLSWDKGDFNSRNMLPKITLIVGEKEYNFTLAGWVSKPLDDFPEPPDDPGDPGEPPGDSFNSLDDPPAPPPVPIRKKKDDPDDTHDMEGTTCPSPCDGIYWYWKTIPISQVAANNEYDLDGDRKEETVVSKGAVLLKYLDYQEGEIDTSTDTVDIRERHSISGRLTGEYEEKRKLSAAESSSTRLTREEFPTNIVTTEEINTQDDFDHLVRLNKITDEDGGVRAQAQLHGDRLDEENKFLWIKAGFNQRVHQRWTTQK